MTDRRNAAPKIAALLPAAYVLHVVEEWFGGFSAWTGDVLGNEIAPERFLAINLTAFPLFVAGTVVALRKPRAAWFAVSFAALLGLNGIVHGLATVAFGRYAPGTITGLLINVPLGVKVIRSAAATMPPTVLAWSIVVSVGLHGLVTLVAMM